MSNIFSDFFSTGNNPKLDEMLSRTRDMAETVSKKSAEHLELSRKRVELLDTKSKLSKLYEKYGQLQYCIMTGEAADEEELNDTAEKIAAAREKAELLSSEIEAIKASFAETVQRTKETIQKEMEKASAPKQEVEVETTVADENDAQE